MSDNQTIIVSGGGSAYTKPLRIREKNGKDISAFPIYMGLGDYNNPPAQWDLVNDQPSDQVYIRRVQHLVLTTTVLGDYWLWIKIVSSPETIIRRVAQIFVK